MIKSCGVGSLGLLVNKVWHKLALLALMGYFSFLITIICLPMMWLYYEIPTADFFLYSYVLTFVGGVIFNTLFRIRFHKSKIEIVNGLLKEFAIKVFCGQLILYILLVSIAVFLTGNIIPYAYISLFLIFGGYAWYCILRGYIKVKKDYESGVSKDNNSYNPWLGRLLYIGITLSFILGWIIQFLGS